MIWFTGIQKTAGTSLRGQIKRLENTKIMSLDHGYFYYPWNSKEEEKKNWIDQGFNSPAYFDKPIYELDTYIAVVRNPFDILVSYYYHGKYAGPKFRGWANVNLIHNINSFSEFVDFYIDPNKPWHLPPMKTSMFSFIYDKDGKLFIDGFFKYENIHKLNQFLITLGLEELEHSNKTAYKIKHFTEYYEPYQVEKLNKIWKKDLDYFNYSFYESSSTN